ncbi:Holliday junction branch migration protein RuvA [Falsarthrobacter nasiphocae]|uniref:Holliday junction branch migration complex subunit RuvA n=1 Tax=Falsarthrobacter nasiphocae TaxID=189863 RepID=A0AAE3YJ66_9MICC|nr:Holliday junction branch migration protein RuvA [Falsarthrobacter nasiphocae]MDR6892963.1 Holliday junction DNA helicase RuvA [Falsarthrobacter nasiphocae]
MISILRGEVVSVRLDRAVVLVGGIGFEVMAPAPTLASLRTGSQAQLYTSMVVREDSMTLYGFTEAEAREAFEVITSISGVGPKLGLAVMSVLEPAALREAIATENKAALQSVPGIGPKSAARMLLELKDRFGPAAVAAGGSGAGPAGVGPQVQAALLSLGWSEKDAESAWSGLVAEDPDAAASENVSVALKAALARLARKR